MVLYKFCNERNVKNYRSRSWQSTHKHGTYPHNNNNIYVHTVKYIVKYVLASLSSSINGRISVNIAFSGPRRGKGLYVFLKQFAERTDSYLHGYQIIKEI